MFGFIMFTTEEIKKLIAIDRTDKFYNDYYWRKLSHEIKREYHNECFKCRERGKYSKSLIVHHVKHLRTHPELAYSRMYEGNIQLMPLCLECHNEVHGRIYNSSAFTNEERW